MVYSNVTNDQPKAAKGQSIGAGKGNTVVDSRQNVEIDVIEIHVFIDDTLRFSPPLFKDMINTVRANLSGSKKEAVETEDPSESTKESGRLIYGKEKSNIELLYDSFKAKKNDPKENDVTKPKRLLVYVPGIGYSKDSYDDYDSNILNLDVSVWCFMKTSQVFKYISEVLEYEERKNKLDLKSSIKDIKLSFFAAGTGAFVARYISALLTNNVDLDALIADASYENMVSVATKTAIESAQKTLQVSAIKNNASDAVMVTVIGRVLNLGVGLAGGVSGFLVGGAVSVGTDVASESYDKYKKINEKLNNELITWSIYGLAKHRMSIDCIALLDSCTTDISYEYERIFNLPIGKNYNVNKVIHIGANDEYREKCCFSPVGVYAQKNSHVIEFLIPGSHEDIVGGGL